MQRVRKLTESSGSSVFEGSKLQLNQLQRVLLGCTRTIVRGDAPEIVMPFESLKSTLIQSGLLQACFNEAWYLRLYPDVSAIVNSGIVTALDHFLNEGFWSGRIGHPFDVDENWYRQYYKDVNDEIRANKIGSAQQHFNEYGFVEGRAARSELLVDVTWYSRCYPIAQRQVSLKKYPTLQHYFNFEGFGLGHKANENS
jgi:hypothetical protein